MTYRREKTMDRHTSKKAKAVDYLTAIFRQTFRNLRQSWVSQFLTLVTILLSVLIFSFFCLIYSNILNIGHQLNDDLRLIVYLDEQPSPELQEAYRHKILKFDQVEKIVFVSQQQAVERFRKQLGPDQDVLEDMPENFLPASIEIYPVRSLDTLSRIKKFSEYLQTLPGVLKVQYGREWVERFYSFVRLMRVVVLLSGTLLVLTTTFTVAHTIRLTLLSRHKELEILRLVGASTNYIRLPYFLEGCLQGMFGSLLGITALFLLFEWTKIHFNDSPIFGLLPFSFLSPGTVLAIVIATTLLCGLGSFSSTRSITTI